MPKEPPADADKPNPEEKKVEVPEAEQPKVKVE